MFRLRALGGLSLESDGVLYTGAASQRRRLALLALLASAGGRGLSREKLVAYLWPEADEARGRHSLDDALSALRRELRSEGLFQGTATLTLNPAALSSDSAEFEEAIAAGALERAVAVYAGPFLDGFHLPGGAEFDRWAAIERDRLASALAKAVETLAERAQLAGDGPAAVEWWKRAANADPFNTRATVGLMRALAAAGQGPEALRIARLHEALLERELQVSPGADLAAAVEAVRTAGAGPVSAAVAAAPADGPVLPVTERSQSAQVEREGPRSAASDAGAPGEMAGPSDAGRLRARAPSWRRRAVVGLAAVVVAATGLTLAVRGFGTRHRRDGMTDPVARRIAIGSVENATGDRQWDALAEMAGDVMAQALTRAGFDVFPTTGAVLGARLRGARAAGAGDSALLAFARRAHARMVVAGTVYLDGAELRLQARVTDVESGAALGPVGPVAARPADVSGAVQQMSSRVLGVVAAVLNPQMAAWTQATAKPPSLEVYEEFAAGEATWPDYVTALRHFERAAALDSTFAMAAIEVAAASRTLRRCDRTDSIGKRLLAAGRDLAPFERLMMQQQVQGCRGDVVGSYETARLMRERVPGSPVGVFPLILVTLNLGRLKEAAALLDSTDLEAAETQIGASYAGAYAIVMHLLGRHERELEICETALRRFPTQPFIRRIRLMALAALGRMDEVRAGVSELLTIPADTALPVSTTLRWLAADLSVHGGDAEAQAIRLRAIATLGQSAPEARPTWQLDELGGLLYDAGRAREALHLYRVRLARDTASVVAHGQVGLAAARTGDSATARNEDDWLASRHDPYDFSPWLFRARIAALLGRREEAVALLREWRTHTTIFDISVIHYPLEFVPLRGYPPLEELLRPKG